MDTSLPSLNLRFVGSDTLPKSLSKREVEECFGLSAEDTKVWASTSA